MRAAVALGALVVLLTGSLAVADDADPDTSVQRRIGARHDASGSMVPPLDPKDWTAAQIKRIERLEGFYICACPKEKYTKTLAGCPDGCADEQKILIRESVREGKSDAEIREVMVERYTSRVVGQTSWSGSGKWVYILPCVGVLVIAGIGIWVLRRWSRAGEHAHDDREARGRQVNDAALDEVRRELEGIE